jgi:hypothetical protein
MAAEIHDLAAGRVLGVMKLAGERRQRIVRIALPRVRLAEALSYQISPAPAAKVPHSVQVRRSMLE